MDIMIWAGVGFGKDISIVIALNENLESSEQITGIPSKLETRIYPNPTENRFTVDLGGSYKKADISISDIMGQFVLSKSYNSIEHINIDLSEYNAGNYFLIINSNEKIVTTHRLLKK